MHIQEASRGHLPPAVVSGGLLESKALEGTEASSQPVASAHHRTSPGHRASSQEPQCVSKLSASPSGPWHSPPYGGLGPPSSDHTLGSAPQRLMVAPGPCVTNTIPKKQDSSYSKSPDFQFLFKT